jgi:hypothetical protein
VRKGITIYFTKIHTLPDIDVRIILRWIFRTGMGGMNCVDQAQDRDR